MFFKGHTDPKENLVRKKKKKRERLFCPVQSNEKKGSLRIWKFVKDLEEGSDPIKTWKQKDRVDHRAEQYQEGVGRPVCEQLCSWKE